jgi:hypothetical protein
VNKAGAVHQATSHQIRGFRRQEKWEPHHRILALKIILAIGLLSGFALSRRLWISSRSFPLTPAFNFLPVISSPLDIAWFGLLPCLLLAVVLMPRSRWPISVFLVAAGLMSFWDQERWQPWFVEYFFLLAAIGLCGWRKLKPLRESSALNVGRMIVAATYFWSGLQKLNANFVHETWPDIARPVLRLLPPRLGQTPAFLALAIPLVEIAISVGLITRRYRSRSVVLAITTHVVVLVLLVAGGENTVVWPWNIAMMLLVVVLFWQENETGATKILVPTGAFHVFALLFFGLLPVLSFFDLWDSYLSAALYSGNTDQAVIYVSAAAVAQLPLSLRPHIWQRSQPFFLDINRWAYSELNVPLYPEPRIYRRVAAEVCREAGVFAGDMKLRIKKKPNLFTAARESEYYDCEHLDE